MLNVQEIAHIQKGCGTNWGKGTWFKKGEKTNLHSCIKIHLQCHKQKTLMTKLGF